MKQQLIRSLRKHGFPEKIIKAFEKVKREEFIPKEFISRAYEDNPLEIGHGQTISQPYTIAFMLDLLELNKVNPNPKIIEIGSGSGYVLALVAEILKNKNPELYGVEIIKELAEKSQKALEDSRNIKIIHGNGINKTKEFAPFDRILISASADEMPSWLFSQLKDNGILVIPVKNSIFQIKKTNGLAVKKEFYGFVFVPLVEE